MPTDEVDLCVIGSGAGASPVALRAAEAGLQVLVLEKGPFMTEADFTRDEIAECHRHKYVPRPGDEPSIVELHDGDGVSLHDSRNEPGWTLSNGSLVGGATNLMSGYFYRERPVGFRQRSALGNPRGAEVADWPIGYDDLEPFYAEAEQALGVSGLVTPGRFADKRSTPTLPLPPLDEHPVASLVDDAARALGLEPLCVPRAIASRPIDSRGPCSYTGLCAAYGCQTGAKASARAALLTRAIATGRCQVRPRAMVMRIESDERGRATAALYADEKGVHHRVRARVFVVACQPVETARLLLLSPGPRHPRGLANQSGLVGRHLQFSAVTTGQGDLLLDRLPAALALRLRSRQPWVNRAVRDLDVIDDRAFGPRARGGLFHFLLEHPNLIDAASARAFEGGSPLLGEALVRRLRRHFTQTRTVVFEAFAASLACPESRVVLDPNVRDRLGLPVARACIKMHESSAAASAFLAYRAAQVLTRIGCEDVRTDEPGPSTNLAAGTCRFGRDPATSVLDPTCRAHDVDNLFVTDASFMPTSGSAPHTFTVFANAFRVARSVVAQLR